MPIYASNGSKMRKEELQLGSRPHPLRLLPVSQQPSQDLPAWTLRNFREDLDTSTNPFVRGFVVLDVLNDDLRYFFVGP